MNAVSALAVASRQSHPYLRDGNGVGVLSAPVVGRGTQLNARPVIDGSTWQATPAGTSIQQAIVAAQALARRTGHLSAVLQATEGVGPWIVSTRSDAPLVALGIVDSSKHPLRADRSLGLPFAERVARFAPGAGHVVVPTLALVGKERALVFDTPSSARAYLAR